MPPDIFDFILPLFAVIAVVIAAWLFTRFLARRNLSLSSGRNINVIERIATGKDSSLLIVKVNARAFLISVSGQNSSLISELDPETLIPDTHSNSGGNFLNNLTKAIKNISKSGGEEGK